MRQRLLPAVCLLYMLSAAQAQTVWRCGTDGRSYSFTPCAAGRALPAPAPLPVEDARAAHAVALADGRLAAGMARQRAAQDAKAEAAGVAGFRTTPPGSQPKLKSAIRRPADAGTWPAVRRASRHTPD